MMDIWTNTNTRLFYFLSQQDEAFYMTSYASIDGFEFSSKANVCAYCGHDVEQGKECPGCAARQSKAHSLAAGKAKVSIIGLMPHSSWLLHDPYIIELHVRDCGRADVYDNYVGKIIMSNITPVRKEITGFDMSDSEALRVHLVFECDAMLEGGFQV